MAIVSPWEPCISHMALVKTCSVKCILTLTFVQVFQSLSLKHCVSSAPQSEIWHCLRPFVLDKITGIIMGFLSSVLFILKHGLLVGNDLFQLVDSSTFLPCCHLFLLSEHVLNFCNLFPHF
eukprot:c30695_g1_i1 orf=297-659(+)